jgi:hypothetical protein
VVRLCAEVVDLEVEAQLKALAAVLPHDIHAQARAGG